MLVKLITCESYSSRQLAQALNTPVHDLQVPEGLQRAHWEDPDAAPSGAVPVPKEATGKVMTIVVDEVTGTLWTGV